MTTRPARWIAAALTLALVAGACGNSNGKSASSKSSSKSSAAEGGLFPDAELNQPQHEGTPKRGGTLTFGLESTVLTLDPGGQMIQPADLTVAFAVYDPLVEYDAKGNRVGGLAQTVTPSADLKTWTFKLRSGIKFSDGTPFDAAAVKAEMDRLKNLPQCSCATAMQQLDSVDTPDPLTVVMHLSSPNVAWDVQMSNSEGLIPSPTAVAAEGADFARKPVGTGPFKVTDYADTITVERNPYYWRKDNGQQLPYLDKVIFKPLPDTKTRLQSLQSGDIQVMQTADTDNLVAAKKDSSLVVQPVSGSSSTILILNQNKPPFNDLRARQALNYSLDRNELNQQAYKGARTPAYGFVPVQNPYYDPAPDAQLPNYDETKAKSLIDAMKSEGKNVNFRALCIPGPEAANDFTILKAQAKRVGVDIQLDVLDQSAFVARLLSGTGDFQVACFRAPQLSDPDDVYSAIHTGGSTNIGKISDPKIDAALDAARTTADFKKRQAEYNIVQTEMAKQVVIVPMLFDLYGNVHVKSVSGLERPHPNYLGLIGAGYLYYRS